MAPCLRSSKKKGDMSHGPTEAPDVADGAVPGTTVSDAPIAQSETAPATSIRPEGFPKCRDCFLERRGCNGHRPCGTCPRRERLCHNVTQEDLDKFPDRAKTVLRKHELQKKCAAIIAAIKDESSAKKQKVASSPCSPEDQQLRAVLRRCYWVINELLSDKYAHCNVPFLKPVDHVALNLPDYPKIVKSPMDLSTMKDRLEAGVCKSTDMLRRDFKKVVDAAKKYNKDGSEVYDEVYEAANTLQEEFDVVWKEAKKVNK